MNNNQLELFMDDIHRLEKYSKNIMDDLNDLVLAIHDIKKRMSQIDIENK